MWKVIGPAFRLLNRVRPRVPIRLTSTVKLSESPSIDLRNRAQLIKQYGACPICLSLSNERRSPQYECTSCGFPTHCCATHHAEDAQHAHDCTLLQQINHDDHDLRSNRAFTEFDFPGLQGYEEQINCSSWDTYYYTRKFKLESEQAARHVSKLLTFPMTMASLLHSTSPYNHPRLTSDGLRSFAQLRYIINRQNTLGGITKSGDGQTSVPLDVLRLFVPGARAESRLPLTAWLQLSYLFPKTPFHLHFIGPEALLSTTKGSESVFDEKEHDVPKLALTRDKRTWQDYRHVAAPFDPYTDVFFLFSPGFGHPINKHKWKDAVKHMLDSKCIVVVTGYHAQDVQADVEWMERELEGEFVWLLKSGENAFKSLKADVNPEDLREFNWTNWGVWAIRGKRYDVIE